MSLMERSFTCFKGNLFTRFVARRRVGCVLRLDLQVHRRRQRASNIQVSSVFQLHDHAAKTDVCVLVCASAVGRDEQPHDQRDARRGAELGDALETIWGFGGRGFR